MIQCPLWTKSRHSFFGGVGAKGWVYGLQHQDGPATVNSIRIEILRANIHTEGITPRSVSAEVHGTLLGDRLGAESDLIVFINTVGVHVIRN